MNYENQVKRFMECSLGTAKTPQQLKNYLDNPKSIPSPFVLDFIKNRLFLFIEFINVQDNHHLHWQDLGALSAFSNDDSRVYFYAGEKERNNFDGFFGKFLEQLVRHGFARCGDDPAPGDYLVNGRGISVKRFPIQANSMENPQVDIFYPLVEADAVEYARGFCSGYTTISRIVAHIPCS